MSENQVSKDQVINEMITDIEKLVNDVRAKLADVNGTDFYVVVVNDAYCVGEDKFNPGHTGLVGTLNPYLFSKEQAIRVAREASFVSNVSGDRFKARGVVRARKHFRDLLAAYEETLLNLKSLL